MIKTCKTCDFNKHCAKRIAHQNHSNICNKYANLEEVLIKPFINEIKKLKEEE